MREPPALEATTGVDWFEFDFLKTSAVRRRASWRHTCSCTNASDRQLKNNNIKICNAMKKATWSSMERLFLSGFYSAHSFGLTSDTNHLKCTK
jgi:hypothetical protein